MYREDELIRRIIERGRILSEGGEVQAGITGPMIGPGDDAAVLGPFPGRILVSTDSFVEDVHWRREWGIERLASRGIGIALGDLAAMGGEPRGLLLALGLPRETPAAEAEAFLEAAFSVSSEEGAILLGGDLVESSAIVLTVTVIGEAVAERVVTRSGARPGEDLVVSGPLGGARSGLVSLERGLGIVEAEEVFLRPKPPFEAGRSLLDAGATAMMDISDGLGIDASRMASASGVIFVIEEDSIPIHPSVPIAAAAAGEGPIDLAVSSGEEPVLLASLPAGTLPAGCTRIGRVEEGRGVFLEKGPSASPVLTPISRSGWEHFAGREG